MKTSRAIKHIAAFALALVLALPYTASAAAPKGGSLGTATVGGTFYTWAGPWSRIVNEAMGGYSLNVEVTGGPVHNVKLVHTNDLEYGLCSMPAAYDGYKGLDWAKGTKYNNIRTLFPMYPSFATFWALEKTGIKDIRDLNGKIFAPGPKGGTPDNYYRQMLALLGIKPNKIVNSGFSDLVGQMADGMIDAAAGSGGEPFGPAQESDAGQPVNILNISDADMKLFVEKFPSWFIGERKPGGYKNFTAAKPALQYWNIYITNNKLPDDIAYNITKAFFENKQKFQSVYAPTVQTVPSDILRSAIPVHKGAAKYYKEQGVDIPASLIAD